MPSTLYEQLGVGEPKPTRMTIQLADRSITFPKGIAENMLIKVDKFVFPADFVILDMVTDCSTPLILGRPFLATARALVDVLDRKLTLRVGNEEVIFNIDKAMNRYNDIEESICFVNSNHIPNKEKYDEDDEEIFHKILSKTKSYDKEIDQDNELYDSKTNVDLSSEKCDENKQIPVEIISASKGENLKAKSSIEEPPDLELKELPSHLEYVFLLENSKLPVIIAKDLNEKEKEQLIQILKSHKQAFAWKLSDIKGISPTYCTHKILMEDESKPVIQSQRRVNPNIHEVIKKEILKLLEAGLIYPISDSPWVSPIHVVPKKGGMTVILNDKNELIPSRTVTGWRVCIDYRKLNDATRKDHFPLPFIDQMLERLSGKQYYCFLDGFSGYFQIPINPEDQDKTTFTCPYGTFAYRRMPFGLCNAPATFQRCMVAIFNDMLEKSVEVFMDDFSVFGNSFSECLENLDKMLLRCEEANLVLNWEKCHFMVKEGIVLGHKISAKGIEVDKAKIEVISKLPPPSSVKSVRSFLGHDGFYRRFIKDFSYIARPVNKLLEKEAPFLFDDTCLKAFETLKEKLITAPIVVAPDWELPFELICDASDFAIGAVLGQRKEKRFHATYFASKTLTEPQRNYTTTEKELLAVVYAFEKFRSYLVLSKTIVFTDHSALKYLFQKQDAKP
ncbi:MAG TPA: retropepsin-like aspartic protease/reverse transcriptase, partial [Ignavibacteriaceae bacterium]